MLPFALAIMALRRLSAFTTQLVVNLEPVYAIMLATVFLGEGEQLRWEFYAGVGVILAAVLWHVRHRGQRSGGHLREERCLKKGDEAVQ